jgi:hypothetical protein
VVDEPSPRRPVGPDEPAGEMWPVVIEFSSLARNWVSVMSVAGPGDEKLLGESVEHFEEGLIS